MVTWDARQYERFADHRTRPFADLLQRIPLAEPTRIVDLGCGNGLATLMIAGHFPQAKIIGVDSSQHMLDQAGEHDTDGRVDWVNQDVAQWDPCTAEADLIVTNATLQWVPDHELLIPVWLASLPSGGVFAMQVPGNFGANSHQIIRETVADHPRGNDLARLLRHDPVLEPAEYADLLAGHSSSVDAWETTYVQLLDPQGTQENPVLEWVKGTALRPILDALTDAEREPFLADLDRRLAAAYPRRSYGVAFPFRRIFAVAVR